VGVALFGDSGDDSLSSQSGQDTLDGGPGRDRLSGGVDQDRLVGGSGDDLLRGESGDDVLRGGPGRDLVDGGRGFDQLYGDGGDNRLEARDGHTDDVRCRRGDGAKLDRLDMLRGRCAHQSRSGAPRTVPVGDLSSTPLAFAVSSGDLGDSLGTGVGCPADRTRPCTGSLVIRDGGLVFGQKRFRQLMPGRERQLTMHVGRRAVNQAGSGDSRVTLVVTTRDRGRTRRVAATAGASNAGRAATTPPRPTRRPRSRCEDRIAQGARGRRRGVGKARRLAAVAFRASTTLPQHHSGLVRSLLRWQTFRFPSGLL
jgi:Ca2+-binding RTX toxin-like protein